MTDTLDRIVYGKPTQQTSSLYLSGNLTRDDAALWRPLVSLALESEHLAPATRPVGIFAGPGRQFLLAAVCPDSDQAMIETVLLPRKLLQQAAGNIEPLISLVTENHVSEITSSDSALSPLETPTLLPWQKEKRSERLRTLVDQSVGGEFEHALRLLGAALDDRHLLISGFPEETHARIALVQGLMALLPAQARAELTFATHIEEGKPSSAWVVFADQAVGTRWHANLEKGQYPDDQVLTSLPYIQLLRDLWQGDVDDLIERLIAVEPIADVLLTGQDLVEGLNQLAAQTQLREQVQRGEAADPEALKAALNSDVPLPADLNRRYSELLLEHALERRDTEAALLVALKMDEDSELDAAMHKVLLEYLESQPDAVYVFVRTRLNDAMEMDTRWVERLHAAALVSLKVAISDADSETIMNWLRLIAREPASYGLGAILREGILASQVRARTDGDLARYLITLAIKHAPDILDYLLDDEALLAVVPNNLGLVLREHAGDPLYTLNHRGPEMFLVAMARSARAQASSVFTPEIIDQIWKIYTTGQVFNLPEQYLPETVIDLLTTTGAGWLEPPVVQYLTTLMLADGRDELFMAFAGSLAEHGLLAELLAAVLHQSQRSIDDLISLVSQLATAGHIDVQVAVDVYVELLEQREWRQTALPMIEQLARLIQQHPMLKIPPETVWRLLEVAMAARSDMVAKVGTQLVFQDIERINKEAASNGSDSDARLAETLLRLYDSLQWSQQGRQYLLKWWREFVHQQPLTRLSRLDKALENKKSLADCRAVVQTSLAFRRMLSNRSMAEFAEDINIVFSILEDISASFDPSPRQPASFDEETVRSELDARRDEITDHEWRILAKNLKELAVLIGQMGDHRSRGNLVRQNVDRQLLTGEQQPESAVDAMKWMAGYLEGIQNRDENDGD